MMDDTARQNRDATSVGGSSLHSSTDDKTVADLERIIGGDEDTMSETTDPGSHHFGSPNPSELDDHPDDSAYAYGSTPGTAVRRSLKRRHQCPPVGDPSPRPPMSERQQLALLKQITATPGDVLSLDSPRSPLASPVIVAATSLGAASPSLPSGSAAPNLLITGAPVTAAVGQPTPGSGKRGKGVHRTNHVGETSLHQAAKRGEHRRCRMLIEEGAEVNPHDNAGWTPLHEACNRSWYKAARVLIKHGADINAAGPDDITPLHDASANANRKLVHLLLRHGANMELLNRDGKRPIDVTDNPEIRDLLQIWHHDRTMAVSPAPALSPPKMQQEMVIAGGVAPSVVPLSSPGSSSADSAETGECALSSSAASSPPPPPPTTTMLPTTSARNSSAPDLEPGEIIDEHDSTNSSKAKHLSTTPPPSLVAETSQATMPVTPSDMDEVAMETTVTVYEKEEGELTSPPQSPQKREKDADVQMSSRDRSTCIVNLEAELSKNLAEGLKGLQVTICETPKDSVTRGLRRTSLRRQASIDHGDSSDRRAMSSPTLQKSPNKSSASVAVRSLRRRDMLRKQSTDKKQKYQAAIAAKRRRIDSSSPIKKGESSSAAKRKHSVISDTPVGSSTAAAVYDFHSSDSEHEDELKLEPVNTEDDGSKPPLLLAALPAVTNAVVIEEKKTPVRKRGRPRKTAATTLFRSAVEGNVVGDNDSILNPINFERQSNVDRSNAGPPPRSGDTNTSAPSKRVPPLRIVFSRSASDDEQTTEKGNEDKIAPEESLKRQQQGVDPDDFNQDSNNSSNSGDNQQRLTRSQVRQQGLQLEDEVVLHPHKRKQIKQSTTSAGTAATASSVATTCVQPSIPTNSHWSNSAVTVNTARLVTKNSYEACRELRQITQNRWFQVDALRSEVTSLFQPTDIATNFMLTKKNYLLQRSFVQKPPLDPLPHCVQRLPSEMHALFLKQEAERFQLTTQHRVQRERLIMHSEKEVLRIHARKASGGRHPLTVMRILRDQEIYNPLELDKPDLLSPTLGNIDPLAADIDVDAAIDALLDRLKEQQKRLVGRHRTEADCLRASQLIQWQQDYNAKCAPPGAKLRSAVVGDYRSLLSGGHRQQDDEHPTPDLDACVPVAVIIADFRLLPDSYYSASEDTSALSKPISSAVAP